jgi:hypothetical protein
MASEEVVYNQRNVRSNQVPGGVTVLIVSNDAVLFNVAVGVELLDFLCSLPIFVTAGSMGGRSDDP